MQRHVENSTIVTRISIASVCQESLSNAMQMEIGCYDITDEWCGIEIMTDVRHGWRKNAKVTSVVAVGNKYHHVLQHVHITKEDDLVTQRHERIGTRRLY